ncbi:MAG TPA: DUF1501 domain-containing protein [Sandaracinaceae bacterium LLY-WYZ-13_1]|nr:DUF1501 domain-containing protein [Sandaracinaceae bacterium LLY-WYZ-13_1]
MNRRELLYGAAGATVALMFPFSRRARSDEDGPAPFVITVRAGGGWDPTMLCDPVADDERLTHWSEPHLMSAGPIVYAPYQVEGSTPMPYVTAGGEDFWQKNAERAVVINGVDHETVSHAVGGRVALSGTGRDGYPTLSGLVGGLYGKGLPLAYLVGGGYGTAQGMVPTTRMGGTRLLEHISHPNERGVRRDAIHDEGVREMLSRRRREADARLLARGDLLPRRRASLEAIAAARAEEVDARFAAFAEALEGAERPDVDSDLVESADAVLLAMRTGMCAAAHLRSGGARFDTHSGHDSLNPLDGHRPQLANLLTGVDWLLDAAEADRTISERGLVVLVVSEFGRTTYNDGGGKDHWPITSMVAFGVGAARDRIRFGRVVGGTTTDGAEDVRGVLARKVRVSGDELELLGPRDESGFTLLAGHVHVALRHALGLSDAHDPERPLTQFAVPSIPQTPLPIFGPVA